MTKIKTANQFGETAAWYLNEAGYAVTARIVKNNAGRWEVEFDGRTYSGSLNKAEAVKWAKELLKKSM